MLLPLLSVLTAPLLSPPVQAGEFIDQVGDEVATGTSGTWTRAFPRDDGWWLVVGAGGKMNAVPVDDDDYTVADWGKRIELEGEGLADTVMVECPNGDRLMGGSKATSDTNEGYVWMYDPDWGTIGGGLISDDSSIRHNDMALMCSSVLRAIGFQRTGGQSSAVLIAIDGEGGSDGELELPVNANLTGGSLVPDVASGTFFTVGTAGEKNTSVNVDQVGFEGDGLVDLGRTETQLPGVGRIWWPQAVVKVGDYRLLAFMGEPSSEPFQSDEGDVYLAVLDSDWNAVEIQQITHQSPPVGAMRPALARKGSTLLVLYDLEVRHYVTPVELNLVALGYEEGSADSGLDSSADTADSGFEGDGGGPGGSACGCAAAQPSPLAGLGWLAVLGVWGRRPQRGRQQRHAPGDRLP
jgi:MYXO-CTERM domain-containing protein